MPLIGNSFTGGTLTLDVDTDGDGTPDETLDLENQMTTIFLPAIVR